MYMKLKSGILAFEWDKGNVDKIRRKHGITVEESESIFLDKDAFVFPDVRHSEKEDRFVISGTSANHKNLYVIFTIRNDKIRIISARGMHRKEIVKHEKIKKGT